MKAEFGNLEQIKMLQKEAKGIETEKYNKTYRKNMSPLEKAIDDEANIGWSFFVIDNLIKGIKEKLSGRSPIDTMIDKATGHERAIIKEFLTNIRIAYKNLVRDFRKTGRDEQVEIYKGLIKKIDADLKTTYK